MEGGSSSKNNNSKKNSASKAPSIISPTSETKAPTSCLGKQPTINDVSLLSKETPQGLPPLPPSSSAAQYREQDRLMPIANVIRLMRRILPSHAKISNEAKETVQECVSEFISFVTEEANEKCHREQRKTITANDLISAMSILGFDSYVDPLSTYLHKYRQAEAVECGLVTQMPMMRQIMARPAVMVRPSIVVDHSPTIPTAIPIATNSATKVATITTTGSYVGDHGFGLINNPCYVQFGVGSSSSNDGNLLKFSDDFDLLSPMIAPHPNTSSAGV